MPCSLNRLLTKNFPLCSAVYVVLSTFLCSFSCIHPFISPSLSRPLCAGLFCSISPRSLRSRSRETSWVKFPLLSTKSSDSYLEKVSRQESVCAYVCMCVCVCANISTLCCRWSFGDGGYEQFEYKPPYPPSLLCPGSPYQLLLSNHVTYIYSQPGRRRSLSAPRPSGSVCFHHFLQESLLNFCSVNPLTKHDRYCVYLPSEVHTATTTAGFVVAAVSVRPLSGFCPLSRLCVQASTWPWYPSPTAMRTSARAST